MLEIQVVYKEVTINYSEDTNRWVFTLRGRERSAESLRLAKEKIDMPAPSGKPFEKIPAWIDRNGGFTSVIIDSMAEGYEHRRQSYGRHVPEVWVSDPENESRFKEFVTALFAATPENSAAVVVINDMRGRKAQLQRDIEGLIASMERVTLPPEETTR